MNRSNEKFCFAAVLAAIALLPVSLWGQAATATITGIVRDSSGAVIPSATVTARDVQTNATRTVETSGHGDYTIPLLNIGEYTVSATKMGFQAVTQNGIVLQVDQKARIDFTLNVGSATDTVTVSAEASVLSTESASTGTVIDNQKTNELPLNTRSYYDLTQLTANVAPPTGSLTAGTSTSFSVAGQNQNFNSYTLNGLDNNNGNVNGGGIRPSIDAIQEFRILTGVYSAEYGRLAGGQVVVTIKSGTNQLHGNVYEFLRNSVFDSRNYFQRGGIPLLQRNIFGATAGGPIKKDKTFFFAAFEGLRTNQGNPFVVTVPTPAMVSGNFSGLPVVIRNPVTKVPYAGNIIPSSEISAVGQALANFYPAPTTPTPAGQLPTNNFGDDPTSVNNSNEVSIRIDHNLTARDTLNGTANYYRNPSIGAAAISPFGTINRSTAQQHGIGETHIFSPNLVNEFRVGFSRLTQGNTQGDHAIDFIGQYGIANVFDPSYQPICPASAGKDCNHGVPSTVVNGYQSISGNTADPQQSHIYDYQEVENLIWTKSSHTIKFGIDIRRNDTNWLQTASGRGVFNFTAPANSTTLPTSGNNFADLLLGYPSSVSRNPISQNYYQRNWGIDPYVQDDWKISKTLTLNLGLRWELNTPVVNLNDSVSNFDPVTGKIFTPSEGGYPLHTWHTQYHNFAPRVGIAWQPFGDSKTVIRAGAGLFYNQLGSVITFPMALNYPHRLAQTFNSSLANPIALSNPFPAIPNTSGPPPTDGSITLTAVDQSFKDAVVQEWSFSIQRALTPNTLLEVGYLGSEGTHLLTQVNINQPAPSPAGTTTAQIQAKRPYPGFGNITFEESAGNISYQSLEAKVEKRYSHGLSTTWAYTFGKAINYPGSYFGGGGGANGNPQNSANLAASRGLTELDLRHRLVGTVIWEVPLGQGHRILASGPVKYIVGGWQLSTILTAQSGRPVFVSEGGANISNTLGGTDVPNVVAGCNANNGPQTIRQWFDTSCFSAPPIGTFGNEGRNNVIGPGLFNMDVTLSRTISFHERYRVQIRADAYNILNHPNFGQPSGTFGTSSFGTITSALDPRQMQFGLKIYF